MIKIIALVVVGFMFYSLTVLLVKTVKQTSVSEARDSVNGFIKACFTPTPLPERYPIFIGIDNLGYAHADIIEATFKDLRNVFTQCIFDHHVLQINRIIYYFKVGDPLVEMEEGQLIQYVTTICDNTVHNFLHQNSPTYGYIPYLVVTDYRPGTLAVSISFNQPGLNENCQLKYRQSHRMNMGKNAEEPMSEDWEDKL